MSLSIRPLLKKAFGECALCKTQRELSSWDSNLAGRICEDCEPFLGAAEIALVAAKCGPSRFASFSQSLAEFDCKPSECWLCLTQVSGG